MALDVWLKRGKTVNVGGKDLYMMPLPIKKLFAIGYWIEENSKDVIQEAINNFEPGQQLNPLVLVVRVLSKIDVSHLAYQIFSIPKDPITKEQVNKDISVEFFEDYLDIPTAHLVAKTFIELNDVEEIIKNLQSLPEIGRA